MISRPASACSRSATSSSYRPVDSRHTRTRVPADADHVAGDRAGSAAECSESGNAIARLQREGCKIIAATPQLQRRFELLQSTPRIGAASALQLLGELALTPADCDVRQWVAYAGLDPRQHDSGSSVHQKTRIRKVGNRHLRRILYMPALTAVRFAPHLRAF